MYLTVTERRNVSLNCRVTSDPPARVSWIFNGLLVDAHHPRMRVVQLAEDGRGTRSGNTCLSVRKSNYVFAVSRSQLVVVNSSLAENGSYICTAENRAGTAIANYT
jgi:hypothetical protein